MFRYLCIEPSYETQRDAEKAKYAAYERGGTQRQRDTWICIDGHWHEGVLDD